MQQFQIPVFLLGVEKMENNKRQREMRFIKSEPDEFKKFDLGKIDKLKCRS